MNKPGYLRTAVYISWTVGGAAPCAPHCTNKFLEDLFVRSTSFYMNIDYEYSNFCGEETFEFLCLFVAVSSVKFVVWLFFGGTSEQSAHKSFFFRGNLFFHQFTIVFSKVFPLCSSTFDVTQ